MAEVRPYAFEEPGVFARGWHIVALSQELPVSGVKALHYFNEDLVLFRGENGSAVVADAYCPHLGAHLAGTGSCVVGNSIRCPFHGWQFDSSGSCTAIPYASKIPDRARNALRTWALTEKNGFISIWYDPEGGAPNWQLPDIPEWNLEGWGDWRFNRTVIKSHGREIIENIVDSGHFPSVHGGIALQFDNVFTPYSVSQESRIQQDLNLPMIQPRGIDFDINAAREAGGAMGAAGWGVATYHGPSVMYYYTTSKGPDFSYASWWLNYHTPINNEEVELVSGVIVASLTDEPLPQEFYDNYPISAIAAFGSDVEVWETKKYRRDPILCDGDGPINKLRKWYERFYLPREGEAWDEPERVISSVRS
ncbi:MAG: 3-ketosteroid 9alpha-monooxygenase subunit A [Bermanella sp.]|jgi:3-ketosteroid 9alpha-monooxygenase subunit A